ncbi:hypothetical protein RU639_002587 [Aspergillus parasiticus]
MSGTGFRVASRRIQAEKSAKHIAAKETSGSADTYWVIDLLIADISLEAKRDLAEEYANERKLDDGEFYYKIRQYQGVFGPENSYFERRWWARLAAISVKGSTNPKDRLEQLLGHLKFAPAFDAFRHLPAFYCGLRLSAVNKMTSIRCDEELLSYLKHIRDFWYAVFGGNKGDMHRLDAASVRALELKAPGASDGEARGLYGRLTLVPSLSEFFDDLKHLKLVADSVKWLVRLERRETIRSALEYSFSDADHGNNLCLVQTSSSSFRSVSGSDIDWFDVAYRVLWLYALREYLEMPAEPKKKLAGPQEWPGQRQGAV